MIFDADDNKSLGDAQIRKNRLHFGMVIQSFNHFPQYTALRNCTLARELMAKERPDFKENKKKIMDEITAEGEALLESVGLKEKMNYYPHQLSGGQQQRVAIAKKKTKQTKCIILDEPTAMLDPNGRKEVLEAVSDLNRREGVTVILITHYMEEVVHADKVYVMDNGEVVMQGTPREIFSQVETLKEYRLDVPQVTLLAHELHKAGVDVPEGILTTEELVNALCQ